MRTLLALTVACAWAAGALAGGAHHDARLDSGTSTEVITPSSMDESAPSRAMAPQLPDGTSRQPPDIASGTLRELGTGATSGTSGSGSVGSEPAASGDSANTEYWLIGAAGVAGN